MNLWTLKQVSLRGKILISPDLTMLQKWKFNKQLIYSIFKDCISSRGTNISRLTVRKYSNNLTFLWWFMQGSLNKIRITCFLSVEAILVILNVFLELKEFRFSVANLLGSRAQLNEWPPVEHQNVFISAS